MTSHCNEQESRGGRGGGKPKLLPGKSFEFVGGATLLSGSTSAGKVFVFPCDALTRISGHKRPLQHFFFFKFFNRFKSRRKLIFHPARTRLVFMCVLGRYVTATALLVRSGWTAARE